MFKAQVLFKEGRFSECMELLEEIKSNGLCETEVESNIACVRLKQGFTNSSLVALHKACTLANRQTHAEDTNNLDVETLKENCKMLQILLMDETSFEPRVKDYEENSLFWARWAELTLKSCGEIRRRVPLSDDTIAKLLRCKHYLQNAWNLEKVRIERSKSVPKTVEAKFTYASECPYKLVEWILVSLGYVELCLENPIGTHQVLEILGSIDRVSPGTNFYLKTYEAEAFCWQRDYIRGVNSALEATKSITEFQEYFSPSENIQKYYSGLLNLSIAKAMKGEIYEALDHLTTSDFEKNSEISKEVLELLAKGKTYIHILLDSKK